MKIRTHATDLEIEAYRRDGFVRIPEPITSDDEISRLRSAYDEVMGEPHPFMLEYHGEREDGSPGLIRQLLGAQYRLPELSRSVFFENARNIARSLLDVPADRVEDGGFHLIYKPANAGRDAPWHQDEAYWDVPNERKHSVSLWLPLDEATVDSGCMQFVPGSQSLDLLRHRQPAKGEPLVLDEPADLRSAVACPLPPGAATFHHCRTLHYTGPNVSDRPRRAIGAIFHGPSQPRAVPIPRTWLPAI